MAKRSLDGISILGNSHETLINSGLEDINNLLYLETFQRFKDHETSLRSQADEKARSYQEAKAEYRHYYERFVQLYQSATARAELENKSMITKDYLDQLESDLSTINQKVTNEESIGHFVPEIVERSQQAIRSAKNHDKISNIKEEIAKMKHTIETIQSLNASVEQKLELVTTRSIDFYTEQMQANLEKELEKQFDG